MAEEAAAAPAAAAKEPEPEPAAVDPAEPARHFSLAPGGLGPITAESDQVAGHVAGMVWKAPGLVAPGGTAAAAAGVTGAAAAVGALPGCLPPGLP